MFLFYFSITLAILSSSLYHFSAKSVPSNINFAISLIVTYLVALGITFIAALLLPAENGFASAKSHIIGKAWRPKVLRIFEYP